MKSPGTGARGGQEGDRKGTGRGKRREETKKGRKTSITEINLPALIVKNNRFIDSSQCKYLRWPMKVLTMANASTYDGQ